jgi:hypothetical protein
MKEGNSMKENGTEKRDTTPVRICFQSAEKVQASIARLIRARYKGKVSDFDYKSLLYGFTQWLAYNKHLKEIDIEKRLEALEEQIALKGEK